MISFIVIVNDTWIQEPKHVGRKQFSKLCIRALKTLASLILSSPGGKNCFFLPPKALHVSGFRPLVASFFWGPKKLQDNQPTNKTCKACPLDAASCYASWWLPGALALLCLHWALRHCQPNTYESDGEMVMLLFSTFLRKTEKIQVEYFFKPG